MTWSVRIGINPISWSNDDLPELGGDTPLEVALQEGREIGYSGFELGNKFPKDGPGLKAKLDEFGLACVSGWYSGFLAEDSVANEIERCQQHMAKLQYNQVDVVVYGECGGTVQGQMATPLFKRPRFRNDAAWQGFAERLNAFGRHIVDCYGVRLAYHHHMGSYVETPEDIDRLMALTDPRYVHLLFDSGHAYFGGAADPLTVLQRHIDRVIHVHCKDVRSAVIAMARNQAWSFLQSVLNGAFTVPGDGAIDFAAILKLLRDHSYRGWLVVEAEQDPAVALSYQYAQKGYQTLSSLVSALS